MAREVDSILETLLSECLVSERTSIGHVILCVEGAGLRTAVEHQLICQGYRVSAVRTAANLLALLEQEAPDAVVVDDDLREVPGSLLLEEVMRVCPQAARLLIGSLDRLDGRSFSVAAGAIHACIDRHDAESMTAIVLDGAVAAMLTAPVSAVQDEVLARARGLLRTLSLRGNETEEHCLRLAARSRRLALEMGLSAGRARDVELGALLHDIGQAALPEDLLLKEGAYNEREWTEIRRHPEVGARILASMPDLHAAIPIVQCHHERPDGKGYPRALRGAAVPVEARIFHVADAYDAMTCGRAYRAAVSDEEARFHMKTRVGTQFDPDVFDAFSGIDSQEWEGLGIVHSGDLPA